ncbi:MAG TPA: DNA/RNA non-specific endonuclease [Microvirga sp.]|jgi:endonuclease G|nr:DNA/RNA non-specific endonuclease [Microvirga sp.]
MTTKQEVDRAVRERLADESLLSEITHSLGQIRAGKPLQAEPDPSRRIRRVQAVTGLSRHKAEAVANYVNLDSLDLDPAERSGAESVRGRTVDFVGAAFLAKGAAAARAVGRVAFKQGPGEGTGFLISNRLLITNNHVIPNERAAVQFVVEFDYELDLNQKRKAMTCFELDPDAFFLTDDEDDLDFTVVALGERVSGPVEAHELGFCPSSGAADKHALGDCVNIVQHPDGRLKEIVVRENSLVARGPFALHYLADTEGGSSGSPVFNDQWEVVALHHWGVPHREVRLPDGTPLNRDVNEGIRASVIVQEFEAALRHLDGPRRALLAEALRLGIAKPPARPAEVDSARRGAVGEARRSGDAPSPPGDTHGSVILSTDGSATWRVPIDITVRVGQPAALPAPLPASGDRPSTRHTPPASVTPSGSEKAKVDRNYKKRRGYSPAFLPGHPVDLPALSDEMAAIAAPNFWARPDDDPHELKYQHFSVVMNGRRRLAFFTATNIDGGSWKSINRKTGTVESVDSTEDDADEGAGAEGREAWYEDPRVEDEHETDDTLYLRQKIDGEFPGQLRIFERGHLTRRQDPAWGDDDAALRANEDTFHFTNCTPQIGFFNEGKAKRSPERRKGKGASGTLHWRAIEDYVLENAKAKDQRVTVFTGPIFDDANDFAWRQHIVPDFRVPREFWKVVVRVQGDDLVATALRADQSPLIDELPEERFRGFHDLAKVKKYHVSVREIEEATGLDFGKAVREADTFVAGAEARRDPLLSLDQVSLERRRADADERSDRTTASASETRSRAPKRRDGLS